MHRRMTKLEAAFYRRHPRPNVEPSHQDILHARGLRRGTRRPKPGDKFVSQLHSYSTARLVPNDRQMKVFVSMGWVGVNGKITKKGRKALNRYRRRMISLPTQAMMLHHSR